jgi:hypothetical protein
MRGRGCEQDEGRVERSERSSPWIDTSRNKAVTVVESKHGHARQRVMQAAVQLLDKGAAGALKLQCTHTNAMWGHARATWAYPLATTLMNH